MTAVKQYTKNRNNAYPIANIIKVKQSITGATPAS